MVGKSVILIADDEVRIRKLVSDFFNREGYETLLVDNGSDAYGAVLESGDRIKLIVLDIMMPQMSGIEALEKIRLFSSIPVILLTARSEENDQLCGFRLGADDYVCKPFSPSVLVARAKRILSKREDNNGRIEAGPIIVDVDARKVTVECERLLLTNKEFELLVYFIENKEVALSRDMILNAVWNYNYDGDLRTVDTHVKQLRAKLKTAGALIQTVRGFGYRFEVMK